MSKSNSNKKFGNLAKIGILSAAFIGTLVVGSEGASAHGFVEKPASRGYMGVLSKQALGDNAAQELYGNVIYNPQGLEAPKGFPEAGPADGHIASANGGLGQIGDNVLDNQTASRWVKQDMKGGPNSFTWNFTAPHKTSKWTYYITKKGWDPNDKLERSDFELLTTIQHDGSAASNNPTHNVNLPTDRSGYNVVLAVWDVEDTPNAFYNVIDINLINDGSSPNLPDTEAPTAATNVKASEVTTSSAKITWATAHDNVGVTAYDVYRDDKKVGTVSGTTFVDTGLKENTSYKYTVKAIDAAKNESVISTAITVTTQNSNVADTEAPTAATGLHTMSITSDTANLMWSAATDNIGVQSYKIFRDGKEIATTTGTSYKDTGLNASTSYTYTVKAVDMSGNVSATSAALNVTTKEAVVIDSEAPTTPTGLHTMSTTSNSTNLMWSAATDNIGVQSYKIFRNGKEIATTTGTSYKDTGLNASTNYTYTVKAVDVSGNISVASNELKITTSKEATLPSTEWKLGSFTMPILYSAGQTVTYQGTTYKVFQTHYNYGDQSWAPSSESTLFTIVK